MSRIPAPAGSEFGTFKKILLFKTSKLGKKGGPSLLRGPWKWLIPCLLILAAAACVISVAAVRKPVKTASDFLESFFYGNAEKVDEHVYETYEQRFASGEYDGYTIGVSDELTGGPYRDIRHEDHPDNLLFFYQQIKAAAQKDARLESTFYDIKVSLKKKEKCLLTDMEPLLEEDVMKELQDCGVTDVRKCFFTVSGNLIVEGEFSPIVYVARVSGKWKVIAWEGLPFDDLVLQYGHQ